jgi:sugar lactone lactonase YvrE
MRSVILSLLLIIAGLLPAIPTPLPSFATATSVVTPALNQALEQLSLEQTGPEPLPRGCGGVTPPGEELAACCLSGFVYIDGEIVAGAEVTITSQRGDSVVLYTQVDSGTESRPFYQLSLSAPPLNIVSGETITVTARYSSHEQSVTYTVQPGSQQVDVVLSKTFADDYVYEREIWNNADPGYLNRPDDVAIDTQGNIFVADTANARIQVFNSNGEFVRTWGERGILAGQFIEPSGLSVDSIGNIYVIDVALNRVQKFSNQGVLLLTWGHRGQGLGQFNSPYSIAVDSRDAIYILDSGNSRVQKFSNTGEWLTSWGTRGSDNGQLRWPRDIAIDRDGNIYIADTDNSRVQVWDANGVWVANWNKPADRPASWPEAVEVSPNNQVYVGEGRFIDQYSRSGIREKEYNFPFEFQFSSVYGLGFHASGDFFAAHGDRLHRFKSDGTWLGTIASPGNLPGQLDRPGHIALDSNYNVYVADSLNDRIQIFNPDGTFRQVVSEFGSEQSQFKYPQGIAISQEGNIYLSDGSNHRIQQRSSTGQWIRTIGNEGSGIGQLYDPHGLATDNAGNLYVVDTGNNRITKWSKEGAWISSWGGFGTSPGQFDLPLGIAISEDNRLYVADSGNNRIQVFDANEDLVYLWNTPQVTGLMSDITVDGQGNLLVSSSFSGVYKYTPDGLYLGKWGANFGFSYGESQNVAGVAWVSNISVVVSDKFNNRIQIFRPMTYTRPIATITHISAPSIGQGETVTIRGMGQDSDETPTIAAYRWTSSKDGVVGTTETLTRTAASLSSGTHRVTLEVQDNEGEWSEPVAISVFVAAPPQVTWTALLYLAGDYPDRGSQFTAFNAALEQLGTSLRNPAVRVAAQIDGPADGDSYRLLIIPGNPPQVTRLENIGEQAMDHPDTLAAFLRWGQGSFPANNYYLTIANHGQAIQGIAWDRTSDEKDDGVLNYSAYLTPAELGQALRADGVAPISVLHLDACSMNLLEVAYELRPQEDVNPQSRLLIASQYLGWNYFAYDKYINAIGAGNTPVQVAQHIVNGYAERAKADRVPYTIAALDLGRAKPMAIAVDNLAAELAAHVNNDRSRLDTITAIWKGSPRFESNGDYLNNDLDDYIDLPTWASKIQLGVPNPVVKQRAFELINELTGASPFILSGTNLVGHGNLPTKYAGGAFIDLSNSSGVSIFYPGRQDSVAFESYIDNRIFAFTRATRWADFLVAGISSQSCPTCPREPLPGPLTGMDTDYRIMLPLLSQ